MEFTYTNEKFTHSVCWATDKGTRSVSDRGGKQCAELYTLDQGCGGVSNDAQGASPVLTT